MMEPVAKKAKTKSWKTYFPNRQLDTETSILEGSNGIIIHGKVWKWWMNGKRMSITNFIYGKKDGLYQAWHINGAKQCEVSFVDDKEDGKMTLWNDDGVKTAEIVFVNGKKHGVERKWSKDGILTDIIPYVNGRVHGPLKYKKYGKMHTVYYIHGEDRDVCVGINERARILNVVLAARSILGRDMARYIGAILREESWAYL